MEQESQWVKPKYDKGTSVFYTGGSGHPLPATVESLSDVLHGCIYYVIQTEHGRFDVPEHHLRPNHAHKICIAVDSTCDMARVELNGELVMEGNFWDFHAGCHGITKYGDFNTYKELSTKIYQHLLRSGIDFRTIKTVRTTYSYS